MSWALALAVCALMIAVGFWAGWSLGRRAEVQRQVDAVLRRETQLRHPVIRGRERTGARPVGFGAEVKAVIDSLPSPEEQIADRSGDWVREAHARLDAIEQRYGLR